MRLALGEHDATTSTTLVVPAARDLLTLQVDHELLDVDARGVSSYDVEDGVVRLHGVAAGARVRVTGRVGYRPRVHGLARLVDPDDGSAYVVASGALGGAAHFAACEDGPGDLMPTSLVVEGAPGTALATGDPDGASRFVSRHPLASHHLALAAGPWRRHGDGGASVLVRGALHRPEAVATLLADTHRALAWLTRWFGEAGPWGPTYAQVLLPDPPWLAMEHPGCVLLSERLLESDGAEGVAPGRRVAVLAHEAAHQWLGNLVVPGRWADVSVFEGLAELLGQLACEELLGDSAAPFLARRRSPHPVASLPHPPEARTAGLAEVARPVEHAELLREVREELGAAVFRERVRGLCRRSRGTSAGAADLWAALGVEPRRPVGVRLPVAAGMGGGALRRSLEAIGELDPATAVARARRAFHDAPAGPERVGEALALLADPDVPPAVAAGLSAELVRGLPTRAQGHDPGSVERSKGQKSQELRSVD